MRKIGKLWKSCKRRLSFLEEVKDEIFKLFFVERVCFQQISAEKRVRERFFFRFDGANIFERILP